MNIVIVGGGGHGHVVAAILAAARRNGGAARAIGYVDDASVLRFPSSADLPWLGTIAALTDIPHDAVVVAIGDNRIRARIMAALASAGEQFATVRHPSLVADDDVGIGDGSMLCAGAVVVAGARIG